MDTGSPAVNKIASIICSKFSNIRLLPFSFDVNRRKRLGLRELNSRLPYQLQYCDQSDGHPHAAFLGAKKTGKFAKFTRTESAEHHRHPLADR